MNARARGLAKGAVLLGMIGGFVAINAPAQAGSDSPTPYTVTADGITLPAGTTFPAHGHVNWRTSWAQHGVHFDPNNGHHGAKYIGASFIPFNLEPGECVVWTQVSLYDEHDGEGGKQPVCRDAETEPSVEPEPTPTPTTTAPTEEPTWPSPPVTTPPSATPSETPKPDTTEPAEPSPEPSSTSPEPEETSPTPEPSATESGPTEGTTGSPSQPDPIEPTTPPAPIQCDPGYAPGWLDENGHPTGCVWNGTTTNPEPEETPWTPTPLPTAPSVQQPSVTPSEPSSAPGTTSELPPETAGQSPTTPGAQPPPPSATSATPAPPSLAVTGSNDPLIGVVAGLACVLLGTYLYLTNHRRKP